MCKRTIINSGIEKIIKLFFTIYGGGAGMLIQCQPIIDNLKNIKVKIFK